MAKKPLTRINMNIHGVAGAQAWIENVTGSRFD